MKRMFARFGIKVTHLHRESIGRLNLAGVAVGGYRELTGKEIALLNPTTAKSK